MTSNSDSRDTMNDSTEEKLPNINEKSVEPADGSIKPAILNYRTPDNTPALGGYAFNRREKILAIVAFGFVLFFILRLIFAPAPGSKMRAIADIAGMKTALGLFQIQNNRFPTTTEGLNALVANPGNLEHWEKDFDADAVALIRGDTTTSIALPEWESLMISSRLGRTELVERRMIFSIN